MCEAIKSGGHDVELVNLYKEKTCNMRVLTIHYPESKSDSNIRPVIDS